MNSKTNIFQIEDYQFTYPYCHSTIKWRGMVNVKPNERILLTGNSGAGKSTLLYALKGFFPDTIFGKTAGNIFFLGKNIEALSVQEKLQIGLLFQNPETQIVHKKVRNELAFGLENLTLPAWEIKKKIRTIAKEFQVEHLLERNIATLSGGEKQKIALLSILLMNPQVLLLDEPTAFLDESAANDFITAFYQMAEKKTIVIVEHNLQYLQNHITKNLHIDENGTIFERSLDDIKWQADFEKIPVQIPQKPLWQIQNLAFSFGDKKILSINHFTIYKNEILGIRGKNGSGKTTFLKILCGLLRKYSGELVYNGKKQVSQKELFKDVSLLFQNPENHFLFSTVSKEVSGNLQILERLGLSHLAENNPFNLSEGEKRRLSFAIQLSLNRNIFLLDEPTFGQDVKNRANLLQIISSLRETGATFVIVSHDSVWLKAACDRIVKLENGTFHEA